MPDPVVYTIVFTRQARKDLDRLTAVIASRIADAIAALASDPRPAGCLKIASEKGLWRIRIGDYCVAYAIDDERHIVTIARIGHRSAFYD